MDLYFFGLYLNLFIFFLWANKEFSGIKETLINRFNAFKDVLERVERNLVNFANNSRPVPEFSYFMGDEHVYSATVEGDDEFSVVYFCALDFTDAREQYTAYLREIECLDDEEMPLLVDVAIRQLPNSEILTANFLTGKRLAGQVSLYPCEWCLVIKEDENRIRFVTEKPKEINQ